MSTMDVGDIIQEFIENHWPTEETYYHPTGSSYRCGEVFPGLDEYVATGWSKGLDTWQCEYCGINHWVEDRELQCTRGCGGPRDV